MTNETAALSTPPPEHQSALSLSHRHPPAEWAQRRYAASLRLPPLPPCGCRRDPDHDVHRCHGEMTLAQADAVIAAAAHLDAAGLRPVFDVGQLREVWKLCPEHRSRIEELAHREAA
jgi:hypothetical protein